MKRLAPPNYENTSAMSFASNLAGKAINISNTIAPHAVSYPFTSFFNISHGHAVSLTLNKFIKFNYENLNYSESNFDLKKRFDLLFEIAKVNNFKDFDLLIQNLSYRLSQEVPLDYKAWLEKVHLMKDKEKTYEIVEELTNLKLLAEQSRQELPGYLVPYLYPIIYFDQLKKEAEKFELDPYLLLAIIREASQFSSYSRVSDRYGLFRLDPSVVKEYAFRLGHHWEGRSQLLNAKNNIIATYVTPF